MHSPSALVLINSNGLDRAKCQSIQILMCPVVHIILMLPLKDYS